MAYFKKSPAWAQLLMFLGIAFGSFFILGTAGILVLSKITGFNLAYIQDTNNWDYGNPKTFVLVRGLMVIQFLSFYIIPVFFFAKLCDNRPFEFLGLRSAKSFYFVLGAVVLIAALPIVDWTGTINHYLIPETSSIGKWMKAAEEEAAKQISYMLKGKSVSDLLMNLFFVAVLAGVGEELFFRGILQRLFIKIFKNPWAGIIMTAIIFSAVHLQFYGFIPRCILGILLGLIYWYSGSLWPAIIAHFVYDGFAVVMIYFNPDLADKEDVTSSFGNQLVLAVISAILTIIIIRVMKRRTVTTYEMVYGRDKIDDSNPFTT